MRYLMLLFCDKVGSCDFLRKETPNLAQRRRFDVTVRSQECGDQTHGKYVFAMCVCVWVCVTFRRKKKPRAVANSYNKQTSVFTPRNDQVAGRRARLLAGRKTDKRARAIGT